MKSSIYLLTLVPLSLMVTDLKDSNNSLLSTFDSRCLGAGDILEYSWCNEDAVNNVESE